jgi:hypothetical protein
MFRARDWYCPFDDCPADHLHHMAGRSSTGLYLVEGLVSPLTAGQHRAEHQVWNFLGIGDGCSACQSWLILRRAGAHLVRMGDHNEGGVVILPAETVSGLGLTLNRVADDIDCGGRCHGGRNG